MSIRIGSQSPSMTVRYNASSLDVVVQKPWERVKKIRFSAIIGLEAGDRFRAYLVAGDTRIKRGDEQYTPDKEFFVRRELKADERAIKIEKLRGTKVVATYHAEQD